MAKARVIALQARLQEVKQKVDAVAATKVKAAVLRLKINAAEKEAAQAGARGDVDAILLKKRTVALLTEELDGLRRRAEGERDLLAEKEKIEREIAVQRRVIQGSVSNPHQQPGHLDIKSFTPEEL